MKHPRVFPNLPNNRSRVSRNFKLNRTGETSATTREMALYLPESREYQEP